MGWSGRLSFVLYFLVKPCDLTPKSIGSNIPCMVGMVPGREDKHMASRYDYLDPGTDPAYCNGLSHVDDEPIDDDRSRADRRALRRHLRREAAIRRREVLAADDAVCPF